MIRSTPSLDRCENAFQHRTERGRRPKLQLGLFTNNVFTAEHNATLHRLKSSKHLEHSGQRSEFPVPRIEPDTCLELQGNKI